MKSLLEVSHIVTKKRVKKIEIFDENTLKSKTSKFNEFYESLMAGKYKNDRDAAQALYGCSPTDDKYRQLKSRFRKRLLNTLFFLDVNVPDTSNYDRAYFSCNKDWTLVKILLANDAPFTAAILARQILTTALKYKFADIIVNCARILRQYSAENDEEKEFEEYDQHVKQYSNILDGEIRSEEFYQRVFMNYYKPPQQLQELREKVDTYCDALVSLSEIYDSPVVFYNMFLVWTYRYEMLNNFEEMNEICDRAEQYITQNPTYYQEDKLATFYHKKMSAMLHLRDFRRGKLSAEKSLKAFPEGSNTWFSFLEYYFLLSVHTENYVNAMSVFTRASTMPRYKKLTLLERERWKVYEVYINYICDVYVTEIPILGQQKRSFKVTRFLTDPILYNKDMRIFTIMMLVAQVLFYLERKNNHSAAEVIERLKTYANRQLKKEENYRTIQFIRLLQQIERAEFQADQIAGHEKYLLRLEQTPFFYRGLINELEVVPYEQLWKIVVSRLK